MQVVSLRHRIEFYDIVGLEINDVMQFGSGSTAPIETVRIKNGSKENTIRFFFGNALVRTCTFPKQSLVVLREQPCC
jgi:hypothetical protein